MARVRRRLAALVAAVALAVGVGLAARGAHAGGGAAPAAEAQQGEHGGGHPLGNINWVQGLIGESDEGAAKNPLLWRPKGTPPPVGAMLLNTTVILWLLFRFGSKPIAQALRARKAAILAGMDEAAKMRSAAQARLEEYEEKLAAIESEITRVREELRDAASKERAKVVEAMRERRDRMERDARLVVGQELEAMRAALLQELVARMVEQARDALRRSIGPADQERLAQEFLGSVAAARSDLGGARS